MTQLNGTLKIARKEYAPGDVIGDKYGLVRLLGEGGMGAVWVAENLSLRANVALKLIRADVAEASANERFLSEARLAARLQHTAIVRVFDFGKTELDEPYIVMELLEGETLGQRLGRLGALDPMELCQTLLPIIDALHSAHGHGVIHRDLKPDNVFVAKTEGGVQPKLLDFGIAKLRGEGGFQSTKLTQAGTLIGSPDYMSPEQARGETDLDPRSDVWALCVLAYECLVGKPPFHGDNYNALLWSIIHDEPVPITVFQAGDLELWRILKKGFAKDRNARWESARRLGEALAGWLDSHGVTEDICNRSLQSSWLPTERPTRPELSPFDQMAGTPHRMNHAASIPAPTLAAMRRPHTMSLWFAGLGMLTLVGAVFLSKAEDDISTVDAATSGERQVGTLLPGTVPSAESSGTVSSGTVPSGTVTSGAVPSGSMLRGTVPGPAADTLEPGPVRPAALSQPTLDRAGLVDPGRSSPLLEGGGREGRAGQEPIGAVIEHGSGVASSWRANHEPAARASQAASERDNEAAPPAVTAKAATKAATGRAKAAARPTPRKATSPKKPLDPKKPAEPKAPADTEVDFGI